MTEVHLKTNKPNQAHGDPPCPCSQKCVLRENYFYIKGEETNLQITSDTDGTHPSLQFLGLKGNFICVLSSEGVTSNVSQ